MPSSPEPPSPVEFRTLAYLGGSDQARVAGDLLITRDQVLFYTREDPSAPAFFLDRDRITFVLAGLVRGKPRLSIRTPDDRLEVWVPDLEAVEKAESLLTRWGIPGLGRPLSRAFDWWTSLPLRFQLGIPVLGLVLATVFPAIVGGPEFLWLYYISIALLWFLKFRRH
jgi:hypothetical protein